MSAWNDPRVKPHVREVAKLIREKFGISNIGGWGLRDNVSDHPRGLALDVMTRSGQPIADWTKANARALSVSYIIWDRKIWSVARQKEGWRPYIGPSPHTDHVHISFFATPVTDLKAGIGIGDIADAVVIDDWRDLVNPLWGEKALPANPIDAAKDAGEAVKKVGDAVDFFTEKHNWYRAGLFVLGTGLIVLGVRSVSA